MLQPSRTLVAHFAKYNGAEQAGFKKALSQMSKDGLIEYGGNSSLEITAWGESQVSANLEPPHSNADIHDRIKAMLAPKAAAIFDVLADGAVHTRLEIARATGYPNANVSAACARVVSASFPVSHFALRARLTNLVRLLRHTLRF
jgi:hypothetical protein